MELISITERLGVAPNPRHPNIKKNLVGVSDIKLANCAGTGIVTN
jgi:hypothetical protein